MARKSITLEVTLGGESDKGKAARRQESQAAERRKLLHLARDVAIGCALRHPLRLCTADVVLEKLASSGHNPQGLGGAAGNIFRTPQWKLTCLRVRSRRASSRSREIKVWRLARESGLEVKSPRSCAKSHRHMAVFLETGEGFSSVGKEVSAGDFIPDGLLERLFLATTHLKQGGRS